MLHLGTQRPWFKPHCPQTCKNMCRPLKNAAKKLKRLKINEKVNLKNRNHTERCCRQVKRKNPPVTLPF